MEDLLDSDFFCSNLLENLIEAAINPSQLRTMEANARVNLAKAKQEKAKAYDKKNEEVRNKNDNLESNGDGDDGIKTAKDSYELKKDKCNKAEIKVKEIAAIKERMLGEAADPNSVIEVLKARNERIENNLAKQTENNEKEQENLEARAEKAIEANNARIERIKEINSDSSEDSEGINESFNPRESASSLLYNGTSGNILKYFIQNENSSLDMNSLMISEKMKKSPSVRRIISNIKGELRKKEPDISRLKSLKMAFRKEYYIFTQIEK